jgi:hypothetical protein
MLLLLNSAVMPTEGVYTLKRISEAAFQKFLQEAAATDNFQSYIGYPETARLIEQLTGIEIQVSREQAELATGDVMLIVKLRHRIKDLSNITAQQPSLDDLDFFICHWHPLNEGETLE